MTDTADLAAGAPIGYAGQCQNCGHEYWIVHTDQLPLPIAAFSKAVKRTFCPECDAGYKRINWICRPPKPRWLLEQERRRAEAEKHFGEGI